MAGEGGASPVGEKAGGGSRKCVQVLAGFRRVLARERVACGDEGGSLYLIDPVGIALGPIVVTAVDLGGGPAVRCPVSLERHPLQEPWLGLELDCPGRACHARSRVGQFIAGRSVPGRAHSDIVSRRPGGEALK